MKLRFGVQKFGCVRHVRISKEFFPARGYISPNSLHGAANLTCSELIPKPLVLRPAHVTTTKVTKQLKGLRTTALNWGVSTAGKNDERVSLGKPAAADIGDWSIAYSCYCSCS